MASKSNATPFTDVASLISVITETDADGYEVVTETLTNEVWCSFQQGVARTEFYESLKVGVKASATVEVWEDDYNRETMVSIMNTQYNILRSYPSGHGTLFLTLEEVVR